METVGDFLTLRPMQMPERILQAAWYIFVFYQVLSAVTVFYTLMSQLGSLSSWLFLLPHLLIAIVYLVLVRIFLEMASVVIARNKP